MNYPICLLLSDLFSFLAYYPYLVCSQLQTKPCYYLSAHQSPFSFSPISHIFSLCFPLTLAFFFPYRIFCLLLATVFLMFTENSSALKPHFQPSYALLCLFFSRLLVCFSSHAHRSHIGLKSLPRVLSCLTLQIKR